MGHIQRALRFRRNLEKRLQERKSRKCVVEQVNEVNDLQVQQQQVNEVNDLQVQQQQVNEVNDLQVQQQQLNEVNDLQVQQQQLNEVNDLQVQQQQLNEVNDLQVQQQQVNEVNDLQVQQQLNEKYLINDDDVDKETAKRATEALQARVLKMKHQSNCNTLTNSSKSSALIVEGDKKEEPPKSNACHFLNEETFFPNTAIPASSDTRTPVFTINFSKWKIGKYIKASHAEDPVKGSLDNLSTQQPEACSFAKSKHDSVITKLKRRLADRKLAKAESMASKDDVASIPEPSDHKAPSTKRGEKVQFSTINDQILNDLQALKKESVYANKKFFSSSSKTCGQASSTSILRKDKSKRNASGSESSSATKAPSTKPGKKVQFSTINDQILNDLQPLRKESVYANKKFFSSSSKTCGQASSTSILKKDKSKINASRLSEASNCSSNSVVIPSYTDIVTKRNTKKNSETSAIKSRIDLFDSRVKAFDLEVKMSKLARMSLEERQTNHAEDFLWDYSYYSAGKSRSYKPLYL